MRLVGYVRVSSEAQLEGQGLDIQREALQRWAEEHGHELVSVMADEGVSGTKGADERPGLAEALSLIEEGRADGLLTYSLHRLARRLDVQEGALANAWKHGGRVFTVDAGEVLQDDPDDPVRTFVRQVLGAASQLERGMIAARMRAGRKRKAQNGGYIGGEAPFGYRVVDGQLVEDEQERAVVERIAELRGSGVSLRQIAATLEREGFPTTRGARWHHYTVGRIAARL